MNLTPEQIARLTPEQIDRLNRDVPPRLELGVPVPLRLEFVRTQDVAFAIVGMAAYSTGFSFRFSARLRLSHHDFLHPSPARGAMGLGHTWKPPGLGFAIEYADGRHTVDGQLFPWPSDPSSIREGTTLTLRGSLSEGDRTGRSWNTHVWIHPLPPPGPLAFVYEWPDHGVALTRHEIDVEPILDAAARSKPLWLEKRA